MRSEVPEKETVVCSFRDVAGRCKGGVVSGCIRARGAPGIGPSAGWAGYRSGPPLRRWRWSSRPRTTRLMRPAPAFARYRPSRGAPWRPPAAPRRGLSRVRHRNRVTWCLDTYARGCEAMNSRDGLRTRRRVRRSRGLCSFWSALDLTHNNHQTQEFIVHAIRIFLFLFSSRLLKHTKDLFVRESPGARRSFMTNFDDDCRHHSSQRAPVQGTHRLANPKVRERHSPLHASRGLGTPEAPPQGEEPSPRAKTMSAVGSLAAVPTVSGHSLRALKRASSKASKPVVRSSA